MPAFYIEIPRGKQRILCKGYVIHGDYRVIQRNRVERLGDERQRHHTRQVSRRVFGHRRADRNAVSEKRKSQPPDEPHPRQLRKEHLSRMVDAHAHAGNQTQKSGVVIGANLRGAEQRIEHGGRLPFLYQYPICYPFRAKKSSTRKELVFVTNQQQFSGILRLDRVMVCYKKLFEAFNSNNLMKSVFDIRRNN